MDNVLGTNGVPLTVFGGAVPELAPEDLPEGASPFNMNVDYNPGSVFTRGGRSNQIYFQNSWVEGITQFAQSVAGPNAPNEIPWSNPSNAQLGIPGTYASVGLNNGVPVGAPFTVTASQPGPAVNTAAALALFATRAGHTPVVLQGDLYNNILSTTAGSTIIVAGIGNNLTSPNPPWTMAPTDSQGNSYVPIASVQNPGNGASIAQPQVTIYAAFNTLGGAITINPNLSAPHGMNGSIFALEVSNLTGVNNSGTNYSLTTVLSTPVVATATVASTFPILFVQSQAAPISTVTSGGGFTWGTTAPLQSEIWYAGVVTSQPNSQYLRAANFAVSVPAGVAVLGFQVEVSGNQSISDPNAVINVSLVNPAPGGSPTFNLQLPSVDGQVVVATPLTSWNLTLSPALFNNPAFAVQLYASNPDGVAVTFNVYAVKLKIWTTPSPPRNFNWMQTYEQTDGEVDTLALDAAGLLWTENAGVNPGAMNLIFGNILPNTFAKGVAFADIEYIAFSNLVNGTDIPRQWNGTNFDRISMVGPGAPCSAAAAGGAGGSNTTAIQKISQAAKVQMRRISWGASINAQSDSTPGNVLVISLPGGSTHGGNPPLNMNPGDTIVLTSITNPFPLKGGGSLPYNLNGTYKLQSSGTPIIGGGETDTAFTLQAPATAYGYSNDFGVPPSSGWFYQDCVATVVLQNPLPNVGVGNSIQITGTGGGPPGGFDGTWTVLSAPNASSMTITSVVLVGGVATYSFLLNAGSAAPVAGQFVSIANVLNGNPAGPPGIFNTNSAQIQSVSGNTFSINISNADIPAQSQLGNVPASTAQISGTIFTFDPTQIVNSGNPVTGGAIVQQGLVATGQRKVCYSFLTRSGFISQPSPIASFNVTSGSGGITVSNLATGPSNVVARIVSFTGANGGNFFYIPQEVDVTVPGQPTQINTSTMVKDNTSTSATFSFSDAVLLTATAIDIPGNNLFNTIELGSCRGLLTYASRMFAWSEQNKLTNLRNLSFDGGVLPGNLAPLGWTLDPTSGTGGSLNLNSPIFGWAYQIQNVSGSTQAAWGMLTQPAYQDEFGVPIVQAATLESVRITAQVNPVPVSGNLIVDLVNTQNGAVLGSFSVPLASMTSNMQIYTGTLLTTILQPVPNTLQLRIWAQNIPTGTTILIDRVEPFPTLVPTNTTAFKASYINNQEAFDLLSGVCGPAQNMQPINGAMGLFDLLYALKERSWFSTFDNGVTEPNKWNWKEVSNKVGAIGIHAYDWGEGWALTGDRQGVHFFEGGEPIKVSQEIQPLWDMINWQYGYTMWVRNDPEQKRFTVGVPIPTPNIYMPEFPANPNPTSPNVILMCNYRELNSGAALAQTGPIRSTYTGRLMSPEPARKWSFWSIACPYSDFIDRANNQWPQWFASGYQDSKIFALSASQLSDDGTAINSFWVSYGFVKPEMQDAKGLGLFRMEFPYFTVLATGVGTLLSYVYPESPQNPPYVLDPTPLPALSQGDLEIGVNIKGQRFFVRVGTNAVGEMFRCSKMVVPLLADPWSPVRGTNAVLA